MKESEEENNGEMRPAQTNTVKSEWFGRKVTLLLTNGKQITGELNETTPSYLVLDTASGETQVMMHAIVLIRLSETDQDEKT